MCYPFLFYYRSQLQMYDGSQGCCEHGKEQQGGAHDNSKQRSQLNIPASDAAVCDHGDCQQKSKSGKETGRALQAYGTNGRPWGEAERKRQRKKAPKKERKQGGISYLMVSVIIYGKQQQEKKGQEAVGKGEITHVWNTSHRTGCPESVHCR